MPLPSFLFEIVTNNTGSTTPGTAQPTAGTFSANDNAYVGIGSFLRTENWGSFTAYNPDAGNDGWIVKYDASTGTPLWPVFLQSPGATNLTDIVSDSTGNLFVIGTTTGGTDAAPLDVVTLTGTTTVSASTQPDIYSYNTGPSCILVLKLSSAGALVWHRCFNAPAGHALAASGFSIAVSSDGNLVISSAGTWIDFGGTAGTVGSATPGTRATIAKLSSSTGLGTWAYMVPGQSGRQSYLALDVSDNVYLTSYIDFVGDLGGGTTLRPGEMGSGAFLSKYSGTDGSYLWDHTFGLGQGRGVVVDSIGNAIITGEGDGTMNFGLGNHDQDAFWTYLAGFNSSGTVLWQKFLGPTPASSTPYSLSIQRNELILAGFVQGYLDFFENGTATFQSGDLVCLYLTHGSAAPTPFWIKQAFSQRIAVGGAFGTGVLGFLVRDSNYGGTSLAQTGMDRFINPFLLDPPDETQFKPVYAPSANTTFQSKFGFKLTIGPPPGASNILLKYRFPAGTITPGPGDTPPFMLLNYPDPSGYFGPNAYGFVYKVTGGNGPTWGPSYTTINNWEWAAAWSDGFGNQISNYTPWQNVSKAGAVSLNSNGTVASTPWANLRPVTTQTNRGNLQSVSLS